MGKERIAAERSGAERNSGLVKANTKVVRFLAEAKGASTSTTDMAPSAINGDVIAALDEIKAPAGVVIPPKEIKGQFIALHVSGSKLIIINSYS
jgi:hypothetical protein